MPPKTELQAISQSLAGRRVVVGLSGGLDSVSLLDALVRGGADVRAAHVDHGLRDDSADDARFCADLSANLGVPFASARVEIRPGNSVQGRARIQRYAALARLCCELGGDTIAVAHHADDAWESTILQGERGAGAVGAAGPRARMEWWGFEIVRPLLNVRRKTIEQYAAAQQLSWREDPSNQEPKYARTRARRQGTFDAQDLGRLRERADALAAAAASIVGQRTGPTRVVFDRAALAGAEHEVRSRVLLDTARLLHGELTAALVDELCAAIADENDSLRWFTGRRAIVCVDAQIVEVSASRGQGTRLREAQTTPTVRLTPNLDVPWFGHRIAANLSSGDGVRLASIDGVTLRGPRDGERITSGGHARRIVDVLREHGVPAADRWRWPCIWRGSHCVAVAEACIADDPAIVLPRDDKSGIFVGWEHLVPKDFARHPPESWR